jgi:membrane associated rhomboid family serine protease
MLSTGFADAPVSRSLTYGIVAASILASITDAKHYFYIQVDPHLWRYHQLWRIFTYQLCHTNSTEVLFAAMTIYNMRVIERLWGSRKYAVSLQLLHLAQY